MECGSCFDTYDEETRIPRNLPCGHTYCEMCLKRYLSINKKLECFSCRTRTDLISVSQLSKNFVAAELASKHRELQKKLQLCSVHKGEEIRFFCENCSQNICASCVLDHSGHKFIKQDHSVQFLRVRIGKLKDSLKDKVGDAKKLQSMLDLSKEAKKKRKEAELARIETEFSKLVTKLAERKAAVTAEFEKLYDEEMATVTKEENVKAEVTKKMINSLDDLTKMGEKVEKMKVIQGDDLLKRVDEVDTCIQESLKVLGDLPPSNENNFPKVLFDMKLLKEVANFGFVCRKKTHHRLLFFGEKNKILSLNLKTNEWSIIRLSASDFSNSKVPEFNYYSAAASLPTGDVVITGGGISKSSLIFMNNTIHSLPDMNAIRKEHACVALGEIVFVLGGYDGKVFSFLSSCEKFDFETHKWTTIAPMKVAKCAFAACAVGPNHIYTFGGYDGIQRLNTIERYDAELNEWTVLDIKLKEALSNCAAFSPSDSQIIVLGGGCNNGFSYEVSVLNLIDNKWTNLMSMPEGRDLRNKMIYFQGSAYAIGGNNCKAERLNVTKNEWVSLPNYANHVNDNLDSWACALTFDIGRPKRSHFEAGHEEIPAISQHFDPAVSGLIQPPYMDFDFYNASGVHNINPSYMYMDQHEDISYQNDHDDLNFDESY